MAAHRSPELWRVLARQVNRMEFMHGGHDEGQYKPVRRSQERVMETSSANEEQVSVRDALQLIPCAMLRMERE